MSGADDVAVAAAALVAAFASHDTDSYFASFAPDATFCFHTTDRLLGSRDEYRALWAEWESAGMHVDGCESREGRVDMLTDDVAVFTHRVRTQLRFGPEAERLAERETIVFRRSDGTWLGVHEHLSPDPRHD
jgi:ketosteroid isomerase-like protein